MASFQIEIQYASARPLPVFVVLFLNRSKYEQTITFHHLEPAHFGQHSKSINAPFESPDHDDREGKARTQPSQPREGLQ